MAASALSSPLGSAPGVVTGSIAATTGFVEFDLDGDLEADGSAAVGEDGVFEFALPDPSYGEHSLNPRAVTPMPNYPFWLTYGGWNPISLVIDGDPAPINALDFTPASTGASAQPATLTGTIDVGHPAGELSTTIQFDFDDDGLPDGSTVTASDGSFSFNPASLVYGDVVARARAHRWNELAEADAYSDWFTINFTHDPALPPLDNLSVTSQPDPMSGSAAPTLGGQISGTELEWARVEFDHNDDGIADASTTPDGSGSFSYTAFGLNPGSTTVAARVGRLASGGQFVYTDWTSFNVEGAPTVVYSPGTVGLERDTGTPGDSVTSVPRLSGTGVTGLPLVGLGG